MTQAAEFGTRKVIADHSTIGIVITTDGSIADIPREDYLEAEERVIDELKELGKPFVVLLNSANPCGERAQILKSDLAERYNVTCLAVNCLTLDESGISEIIYDDDKYADTPSVLASKRMLHASGVTYRRYRRSNRELSILV
jgi:stage IV sporulation protein A